MPCDFPKITNLVVADLFLEPLQAVPRAGSSGRSLQSLGQLTFDCCKAQSVWQVCFIRVHQPQGVPVSLDVVLPDPGLLCRSRHDGTIFSSQTPFHSWLLLLSLETSTSFLQRSTHSLQLNSNSPRTWASLCSAWEIHWCQF